MGCYDSCSDSGYKLDNFKDIYSKDFSSTGFSCKSLNGFKGSYEDGEMKYIF